MSRLFTLYLIAATATASLCGPAWSQVTGTTTTPSTNATGTNATGSTGCASITQAAANGLSARIAADDTSINPPMSVTNLTCLDSFFNGIGLNIITSLLDPATLLQAVEGQICNLLQSTWRQLIGSAQCGITLTGFNLGFNLGSGLSCPKLTFGGGGPPIGSLGIGLGSGGGLYINGQGMPPSGYALPNVPTGSY